MEQQYQLLMSHTESPDPWVRERAQIALQIIQDHQQGAISTEEYRELMADLARLDEVDQQAGDLETRTMIVTAIYGLAQVV